MCRYQQEGRVDVHGRAGRGSVREEERRGAAVKKEDVLPRASGLGRAV